MNYGLFKAGNFSTPAISGVTGLKPRGGMRLPRRAKPQDAPTKDAPTGYTVGPADGRTDTEIAIAGKERELKAAQEYDAIREQGEAEAQKYREKERLSAAMELGSKLKELPGYSEGEMVLGGAMAGQLAKLIGASEANLGGLNRVDTPIAGGTGANGAPSFSQGQFVLKRVQGEEGERPKWQVMAQRADRDGNSVLEPAINLNTQTPAVLDEGVFTRLGDLYKLRDPDHQKMREQESAKRKEETALMKAEADYITAKAKMAEAQTGGYGAAGGLTGDPYLDGAAGNTTAIPQGLQAMILANAKLEQEKRLRKEKEEKEKEAKKAREKDVKAGQTEEAKGARERVLNTGLGTHPGVL